MAEDDDKTVFGQPIPPVPGPAHARPPAAAPAGNTVFGQPLPPAGGGPGRIAPVQYPADDTWLGGALPPQPAPPQMQPHYRPATGQQPAGAGIFPDIVQPGQAARPQAQPRIALADALKAQGSGAAQSSNPLIAAAADLLVLLGRLRTGLVDMQAAPLIDHVVREIDAFEKKAHAANAAPQDVLDAKYALSATADDIVQNLPGTDRGMWQEYSMAARFFGDRSSGVGFFQKVDEAMRAPGQRFHLLELMLTCLSLGFEGQYRTMPNGTVESARIRTAIYETLRRVQPRPDDDISPRWSAVPLGTRRNQGKLPLWVALSVSAVMVMALFATLSTLLTRQSAEVRDGILALHQGQPGIVIERTQPVVRPYEPPPSTQMQRLTGALEGELETGQIELDQTNDWVLIRVGQALRFTSGSADLSSDISMLIGAAAAALDGETGPVRVVGHTDSVPPSGRGRYKTNEQLSLARAETVATVLGEALADASRISAEGKGAVDPIADNSSRDGRARNRRVEIMIPREN
ncbi:type IVB secretion system protein IcmH/DotU (plasmid) [Leisingera sp. S132]|uniref:type IVB secretion system protein IcmH/DotU n=1 Tax=Leisingera sp. S132 TaxID=2867016 RepID=UPI0021A5672D|nr:type IVB secretion system protein IcmH/DotU [Leisingera sp. S132]UWQ81747.1 type IVB secretion system protein IcmH/DotU [Leisingera sp. S132]